MHSTYFVQKNYRIYFVEEEFFINYRSRLTSLFLLTGRRRILRAARSGGAGTFDTFGVCILPSRRLQSDVLLFRHGDYTASRSGTLDGCGDLQLETLVELRQCHPTVYTFT